MDKEFKMRKGIYYPNEFWLSKAYHDLSNSARDLLHCFWTEVRKIPNKNKKRGNKYIITNNGEISFTVLQFKEMCGYSKQSYTNGRNQLITNGIIKQTYQGGNCKGDMAQYRLLCTEDNRRSEQRWRDYPDQSWEVDIPTTNKKRVGSKTQWKKGECGRNLKSTLSEHTLNKANDPIGVDPKE